MKRALLPLALLAAGCAPSLHELLPPRHYREALCYARDGSDSDRDEVERALAADADVSLHVHTLSREEIQQVLGDATEGFVSHAAIAHVRVQTNALPVDDLSLAAGVASDGAMAAPVSWEALAQVTRERLPPHRVGKSYATIGNAVAVLTLGLSLLFGVGGDSRPVDVDAPHEEYARMAPRATALYDTFSRAGCVKVPSAASEVGQSCEGFFVIDASRPAPVRLEVAVRFTAAREGGKMEDETKRCDVTTKRAVSLGLASALAKTTEAMFGPRARRLAEIAR